jgi:hypothetical protein
LTPSIGVGSAKIISNDRIDDKYNLDETNDDIKSKILASENDEDDKGADFLKIYKEQQPKKEEQTFSENP